MVHKKPGGLRDDPVIRVEELDILSAGHVQRLVPRIADAGILLVDHPDPAVHGSVFVTDRAGGILASVIHEQEFEIPELLRENTVHAAAQHCFCIVHRDDNTYFRHNTISLRLSHRDFPR